MTVEMLFGVAIVASAVIALVVKFLPKRKPPSPVFRCGRCGTSARHDQRTSQAWRDGKSKFFCQACHAKWLQTRPPRERESAAAAGSNGSGCLGVVALFSLLGASVLSAASFVASAQDAREKFAGSVVHPRDGQGPSFEFSSAYATSASPVVITPAGRKMKKGDREFRVGLQKYWLAQNVPGDKELRMREQVLCEFGSGQGRCDRYEFEPGGEQHSYYFYLNNWK